MALLISSQVYFVLVLAELPGLLGSSSRPSATCGDFPGGVESGESGKLQVVSWTHGSWKSLASLVWVDQMPFLFYCCCMRLVMMGLGVCGHRSLLLTFGFSVWSESSVSHLPSPQDSAKAGGAWASPFLQTRISNDLLLPLRLSSLLPQSQGALSPQRAGKHDPSPSNFVVCDLNLMPSSSGPRWLIPQAQVLEKQELFLPSDFLCCQFQKPIFKTKKVSIQAFLSLCISAALPRGHGYRRLWLLPRWGRCRGAGDAKERSTDQN